MLLPPSLVRQHPHINRTNNFSCIWLEMMGGEFCDCGADWARLFFFLAKKSIQSPEESSPLFSPLQIFPTCVVFSAKSRKVSSFFWQQLTSLPDSCLWTFCIEPTSSSVLPNSGYEHQSKSGDPANRGGPPEAEGLLGFHSPLVCEGPLTHHRRRCCSTSSTSCAARAGTTPL